MPADVASFKAVVPRETKRQVAMILARREQKFTHWLREQLDILVRSEMETAPKDASSRQEPDHGAAQ